MSLAEYKRKRNFRRSPEPSGRRATSEGAPQFVVQKHAASHLHYDFRLEIDGALKSWAVPKGPSLDPAVKSLAVHVEDHPLDYADFEGVIPAGEYGGGTVMVWDHGQWQPEGQATALKQYQAGKLKFTLEGAKLKGSWTLVRMGGKAGDDGKNWLLIKHDDRHAKPTADFDVREQKPRSVVSRRTMEEIAPDSDRVWSGTKTEKSPASKPAKAARRKAIGADRIGRLAAAKKLALPRKFAPQLATLVSEAPAGVDWIHELKFDGYRLLARVARGKVTLLTRNGHDWTHRFPAIEEAVKELPLAQGIIDGEVVALNADGVSDFQLLQNQLRRGDDRTLAFYAFDLPFAEGYDLRNVRLIDRKELLQKLVGTGGEGVVRYSEHIAGSGTEVWKQACSGGLEGIICKQAEGRYVSGRVPGWVKAKCTKRQEFVIGGYTRPEGARKGFGALLLGYYAKDDFVYAGRVGTGFTSQSLRDVRAALSKLDRKAAPFVSPPTGVDARGVTWVKPQLVAEVEFTEWTDGGVLRHPSFQGLRSDKSPKTIKREKAMPIPSQARDVEVKKKVSKRSPQKAARRLVTADESSTVAGVTITHPDRIVYPDLELTKLELAKYYESVAEWIVPEVAGRPLTIVRCPAGQSGQCFYQKHLKDSMPESVRGVEIKENDGVDEYFVVDDLTGLVSLVQLGAMEFHPWPAREDNVERPDRLVFDVDPDEGVTWAAVCQAAIDVRDCLETLGLQSFLRTSGGKGLHVVAPIERRSEWDVVKQFARGVAELMARAAPNKYVAVMSKAKRRGKIFIDYLRNQRGATAVASYSTRARYGAPIATPLTWNELGKLKSADHYTVANLPLRLSRLRHDPWEKLPSVRQSIKRRALAQIA